MIKIEQKIILTINNEEIPITREEALTIYNELGRILNLSQINYPLGVRNNEPYGPVVTPPFTSSGEAIKQEWNDAAKESENRGPYSNDLPKNSPGVSYEQSDMKYVTNKTPRDCGFEGEHW